jgi:hypothetical protein
MINIALLFLLGIAGCLNHYTVFGAGLVLEAFAVFILLPSLPFRNYIKRIHFESATVLEFLAILILFLIVVSKAFRAPGQWDDTMYHLPLARFYVEHQGIALNEYIRFPLFPQNMELLFALGLMMGGDVLAQGMATLPLFIISIGLIGTGVWLLDSIIPGYLSVLLLFRIGPIQSTLGYADIDNGLALFCFGAILALALWISTDQRSKGWIIIAGMLMGGAVGSKYFGGVLTFFLGVYLIAIQRDWRSTSTYAISVIVFGSWWYLRSLYISGDPFHPIGGNIFGHFLWNAQDLLGLKYNAATYGVSANLLNLWPALVKAEVPLWSLAFLSLLFFKKEKSNLRLMQIVFVSYFFFWFFVTQENRYLAPIYAVGSFLSIFLLYRIGINQIILRLIHRKAWLHKPFISNAFCLVVLTPICITSYQQALDRIAHWDESLKERPGYILLQGANKLIPIFGPKLVQVGFENGIYFYRGIAIGDWFGPARYSKMITCQDSYKKLVSPPTMIMLMKGFNSRMLVVNTKRFTIDVESYQKYFNICQKAEDGLLLTKK